MLRGASEVPCVRDSASVSPVEQQQAVPVILCQDLQTKRKHPRERLSP